MTLQLVGCSHHQCSLELRERLAFGTDDVKRALAMFRETFPSAEAVLLSTCNRTEIYTGAESPENVPSREQIGQFFADFHGLERTSLLDQLFFQVGEPAVEHLFTVASSLDSMVVGEAQILSQVKEAYRLAMEGESVGAITHAAFQAAIRSAKRVARETKIHENRVSIPSVAVRDFARRVFETLADKQILVIGAGEMADETITYLQEEGATSITVINRDRKRAAKVADKFSIRDQSWTQLDELLIQADMIVSTTGAPHTIINLERFRFAEPHRFQRPLLILDLAVPRDFEPAIGDSLGVYLYSLDDLAVACEQNKRLREKQWPFAQKIIQEEARRFMARRVYHESGPTISRLRSEAHRVKDAELRRLVKKIPHLSEDDMTLIEGSFSRLVNKLLHPPMASLRDAEDEPNLIDALRRLFHLKD